MTTTPCLAKTTTFFQLLDQTPGLDGRDNRGKIHSTALVLSGLVLALCCGRDGKLSSLHRHMVNHFTPLCQLTQQLDQRPISRAQLPLLLAKVNGKLFARLLFEWFGVKLDPDQKGWFAVDGKDLRGSIQAGHTRRGRLAYQCWPMSRNRSLGKPIIVEPKRVKNPPYVNYLIKIINQVLLLSRVREPALPYASLCPLSG